MPGSAFADFVAPARARPQLWRLAVGVMVAIVVYVACIATLFVALWLSIGAEATAGWMAALRDGSAPGPTLVLLATFGGMALGAIVAAWAVHGRGPATLFGPCRRVLGDFLVASMIVAAVLGASSLFWLTRFDPLPGLDAGLWLAILPLALLGVLVQTGAEELLFRGYLQQQLAARFRSALVWLVLPSIAFGLVHFDPAGAGPNTWIVIVAAATFGLAAADMTAVTGSIGAAWGFHFVNNCVALLLIATQGTIPGLALFVTPYSVSDSAVIRDLVLVDLATLAIAWGVIRRVLRR